MTTNTFDIEKFAKEIGFTFIGRGRKSGTIAVRCDKCLGEKEYYKNSFKRRKEEFCNECRTNTVLEKAKNNGTKQGFKYSKDAGIYEENKSGEKLHYWLCLRCNKEHLYSFKAMEAKKEKDCRECNEKDLYEPFAKLCNDKGYSFIKPIKMHNKEKNIKYANLLCQCQNCLNYFQKSKQGIQVQDGKYCKDCRTNQKATSFYVIEITDSNFSFIKFGISKEVAYRHSKKIDTAEYKIVYVLEYGKKEDAEYIETQLKQMFDLNGFKLKNQKQTSKYLSGGFTETYSTKFREEIVKAVKSLEKGIETTEKEYNLFLDFHKHLKDKGWKFIGRKNNKGKCVFQCLSCNKNYEFPIGAMNKKKTKYCYECQKSILIKELKAQALKIGYSFIQISDKRDKKKNIVYDFRCNNCNKIEQFTKHSFLKKKMNYCKSCQNSHTINRLKR